MIEILVEGGITRFIAVYHDNESEYLGPVRSLRPTDSTLLPAIGAPLVVSGGQPWVMRMAARRGVDLLDGTSEVFRISGFDLYSDTDSIRQAADARGYPDDAPEWLYRVGDWPVPETPATSVVLSWSDLEDDVVMWTYRDGRYSRWNGLEPHLFVTESGATGQISADVLVILVGHQYTEIPTGEGSPVPATETTGSGAAWVISRGGAWTGTWERAEITDPFTLLNPDGTAAVVPRGLAWVSIFPEGQPITIS